MLDALKKAFSKKETTEMSQQDLTNVVVEAATQVDVETVMQELAAVKELSAKQATSLQEWADKFTELSAKYDAAQAALAVIEQEKAEMAAQAVATKLAARKEKVVEMIGTERADALMQVTAEMDDSAFNAVLLAMSVATTTEEKSEMFREVGVSGTADTSKVEENGVMAALKAKYQGAK